MSRKPRRPRKPRMLSLFSGIGGIDLAWEMAGGEIAGQVEIDPFCQQVLARHWPDVQRVADVRTVWGDTFSGGIDLVAGGFPCQPASVAGQRRGAADDRWLWPEALRVIQVYEPAWALFENVPGLISLGLDDVLSDLDAAGYEAWPLVFPAAAIGAPHERERVFIVAHADQHSRRWSQRAECGDVDGATGAHTAGEGHLQRDTAECRGEDEWCGGQSQSRMGGDADGLSRRLDGAPRHAWPALRGQAQHEWEPPRTTQERVSNRAARLKALGNAVVPQQVYPILAAIIEQWRREQDELRDSEEQAG